MYNVYRHLDKNGDIIYIGKSKNLATRQKSHRDNSEWFLDINSIEYITLDSKIEMDIAELYLINKHSPINNKKDNRSDSVAIVNMECNWIKFNMEELERRNKISISTNFLSDKDSIKLSKSMVSTIGLYESFFISVLIDLSNDNFENWIELTCEYMNSKYGISRHKQDEIIKKLKSLKIIDTKLIGMPSKRHFRLNLL